MKSQTAITGHLLLLALPSWGHLKPLCAFSAKVLQQRPDVAITFLVQGAYRKQIEGEIGKYFSDGELDFGPKGNIRIVEICATPDLISLMPLIIQAFPGYYTNLINSKPVQCFATKTTFDPMPKPSAIILDYVLLPILERIRAATGKSIPVYAWSSLYASSVLRFVAPVEFGGFGNVEAQAREEAETTGRKYEDVLEELYRPNTGTVINVPGLPLIYDYELDAQEPTQGLNFNDMKTASYTFCINCDGFVCVSSSAYEPESLDAMRRWLAHTNRPVYAIGFVVPGFGVEAGLSSVTKQTEIEISNNGAEIQTFLDKTLKSHGKHSLIYISFGTVWWPKRTEHVWILVDVLIELDIPFILSHAPRKAIIPPEYAQRIKDSRIGLLSAWSPQELILNHSALGWFLTHCGQNSITEALVQGIPMIAWPLDAEQPLNAAHIALNLDVAFELIEVRTGRGLKTLHRGARPTGTIEAVTAEIRSVLQRARGPEGERKRSNAEAMRDRLKREWEEGGGALLNLKKFLTDNCPAN